MSSNCVEYITKKQLYQFFEEFHATEESVKNDVQYLKEWIRKQPHLPNIEDDEWITNFLFRCKNSLEKTKSRIDAYFTLKALMPEIFQGREKCLNEMEEIVQQGCVVPSLKVTPDGYRIVFFRCFGDSENTAFNFDGIIQLGQITSDLALKLDFAKGYILILDTQNLKMNAILHSVTVLRKVITLGVSCVPIRFHKIYIINSIAALEPVIKMYKRFLKNKLIDKIEVWKDDPKNLISVLPKEVLPTNYGGEELTLEEMRNISYSEVKKYRDWIISEEQHKADLNKKPDNDLYSNNISTNYGVDGSFRKINLD